MTKFFVSDSLIGLPGIEALYWENSNMILGEIDGVTISAITNEKGMVIMQSNVALNNNYNSIIKVPFLHPILKRRKDGKVGLYYEEQKWEAPKIRIALPL